MPDLSVPQRLAYLATAMLFPESYPDDYDTFERVRAYARATWERLPAEDRRPLGFVRKQVDDPVEDNPGRLQDLWLAHLARRPLAEHAAAAGIELPDSVLLTEVPEEVRHAAVRTALGLGRPEDERRLREWFDSGSAPSTPTTEEGHDMPEEFGDPYDGRYALDKRNLPDGFDEEGFEEAVTQLFLNRNADPRPGEHEDLDATTLRIRAHRANVIGALLGASYLDPSGPGFDDTFVEYYNDGFELVDLVRANGVVAPGKVRRLDVYAAVAQEISELKDGDPTYQEVAAVSGEVIDRGPVNDNFDAKVRSALDDFVSKTPVYDSLNLPDIVTDETAQAEVEPTNIRAVSMVYAARELESAFLLPAVQVIAQDWTDGFTPVGDALGRLLDRYVWGARDRLDAAAREVQFERIAELDTHLMRLCSAISERDRAQYLSEYLTPGDRRRSAQPRDAAVRKSARDLLAYASLHGWAYPQFAAKRLGNQIRECVTIVDHPEAQKAYGVQGPWQLVERVATMAGGSVPNIAQHRALAATGKAIMDMLATKAKAIAASVSSTPLFPPPRGSDGFSGSERVRTTVFTATEYEVLLTHVDNWLAASGVNDRERMEASQIRETAPSASLPMFGGGAAQDGGINAGAVKDQLMNMVSAGQMPTMDQLNQLFRSN